MGYGRFLFLYILLLVLIFTFHYTNRCFKYRTIFIFIGICDGILPMDAPLLREDCVCTVHDFLDCNIREFIIPTTMTIIYSVEMKLST